MDPLHIPLWAQLVAAGLGGVQGAMFAAAYKERRIDVLGVVVIGIEVALGGAILRDVLLDQPLAVIESDWYLLVATGAALLGMALQQLFTRLNLLITILDAVVIGLFGAIGTSKALALGLPVAGAIVVGVVAAVGGSILRDVSLALPVSFLQVGSLYAVSAGIGAGALVLLLLLGTPTLIAGLVSAAITAAVRLAAVRFHWTFPEQRALWRLRPRDSR